MIIAIVFAVVIVVVKIAAKDFVVDVVSFVSASAEPIRVSFLLRILSLFLLFPRHNRGDGGINKCIDTTNYSGTDHFQMRLGRFPSVESFPEDRPSGLPVLQTI